MYDQVNIESDVEYTDKITFLLRLQTVRSNSSNLLINRNSLFITDPLSTPRAKYELLLKQNLLASQNKGEQSNDHKCLS